MNTQDPDATSDGVGIEDPAGDTAGDAAAEVSLRRYALHLLALSSLGVAQPILSVLRESPELFVARGTGAAEIIVLALVLVLVPPALFTGVVAVASASGVPWRHRLARGLVGLLGGIIAVQYLSTIMTPPWLGSLAFGAFAAGAAYFLYSRYSIVREYVTILAIAPPVVLGLFLLTSPISKLVLPERAVSAAGTPVTTETPVIFLVFDEWPTAALIDETGQVNAHRYPAIASLADRSFWFPNAVASHVWTPQSLAGLVSGTYSRDGALAIAADYPESIFTLLGATHDMRVFETETDLCPVGLCSGDERDETSFGSELTGLLRTSSEIYQRALVPDLFDDTFLTLDDPFGVFADEVDTAEDAPARADRINKQIRSDQVALFESFLASVDGRDRQFYFQHVFLPHAPYRYLPSGTTYNRASQAIPGMEEGIWVGDEWHMFDNQQRLLVQIKAVDRLIGELVDRLEEVGAFDKSLIVITSDHGVSHTRGEPRRDLTVTSAHEVAWVPLIVKAPYQEFGEVLPTLVAGVDVFPTIADLLGVPIPWEIDGVSAFDEEKQRANVQIQTQSGELFTLDLESRTQVVEHLDSVFGPGTGEFDLYAFGPHAELVGTPLRDLAAVPSDLAATIDDEELYVDVDPTSGFLPAFVAGTLTGQSVSRDTYVAVGLNGTVGTVVPVHDLETDDARFGGLIPESFFVAGDNVISLVALSTTDAAMARKVAIDRELEYRLREAADGPAIEDSEGGVFPVAAEPVTGFVDAADRPGGDLRFSGWAIDETSLIPVDRVVAFVGGEYVGSAVPDLERQGIVEWLEDDGVRFSGYRLRVDAKNLPAQPTELRVFGLAGGLAGEFGFTDSALAGLGLSQTP